MKIGKNAAARHSSKPSANAQKKNGLVIGVIAVMAILIIWVYIMGRQAQDTVRVCMWSKEIYKNQQIDVENMVEPWDMIRAEYEKYTVDDTNGTLSRRLIKYEDRGLMNGYFAAYPLHQDTLVMTDDLIRSRTDNADSVLYSFPGKNIVALDVDSSALQDFKTFLQPGDKLNITAIYSESDHMEDEETGERVEVEVIRQETMFKGIMLADLLNSRGESILDIYTSYNNLSDWEQASYEADSTWQESVTPKTMLVALTPEEEKSYYEYLSKGDVEFKISLPQREE